MKKTIFFTLIFVLFLGTVVFVKLSHTDPFYSHEKTYQNNIPKHVSVFLGSTIQNNERVPMLVLSAPVGNGCDRALELKTEKILNDNTLKVNIQGYAFIPCDAEPSIAIVSESKTNILIDANWLKQGGEKEIIFTLGGQENIYNISYSRYKATMRGVQASNVITAQQGYEPQEPMTIEIALYPTNVAVMYLAGSVLDKDYRPAMRDFARTKGLISAEDVYPELEQNEKSQLYVVVKNRARPSPYTADSLGDLPNEGVTAHLRGIVSDSDFDSENTTSKYMGIVIIPDALREDFLPSPWTIRMRESFGYSLFTGETETEFSLDANGYFTWKEVVPESMKTDTLKYKIIRGKIPNEPMRNLFVQLEQAQPGPLVIDAGQIDFIWRIPTEKKTKMIAYAMAHKSPALELKKAIKEMVEKYMDNSSFTLNFLSGGSLFESSFTVDISNNNITYQKTPPPPLQLRDKKEKLTIHRVLTSQELADIIETISSIKLLEMQSGGKGVPEQTYNKISVSLGNKENIVTCFIASTDVCAKYIEVLRVKLSDILGIDLNLQTN